MPLAQLSAGFQSLPPLPTIKLGPSGADSRVGGSVYVLGPCGSLQRTLLCGWEFLLLSPQPPQVFSVGGLRLYFPSLEPWVVGLSHPQLFLPVYRHVNVGPLAPPATALPRVLSAHLPISAPLTVWMNVFFFNSLVVGLPYSSIFCQF